MDDTVNIFEIFTSYNKDNVCKMDPMLFFIVIMVIYIFLYIIEFRIK